MELLEKKSRPCKKCGRTEADCSRWCHSHSRKADLKLLKWRRNVCRLSSMIEKKKWESGKKGRAQKKWRGTGRIANMEGGREKFAAKGGVTRLAASGSQTSEMEAELPL